MSSAFEKASIGMIELKNRMIRSATWEGMCDPDGRPTQKLIDYYRVLTKGGIGLIITGYAYVRPDGQQMPGKMGIYNDDFEKEYKAMTQAVHDAGGKIAIQIVHAGGQANPKFTGRPPVAPSSVQTPFFSEIPQELSILEIEDISDAFMKAAKRAKDWGFDAVQIHGAHGYLVNQFLSPLSNQRSDAYGGNLENRSRFLFDVYDKIRSAVGTDYPVFIKLNGSDHLQGGLTPEDALQVAQQLSTAGINAIEVSSGTAASGEKGPARENIDSSEKEAYNLDLAMAIKEKVSCPVISVGGFRSLAKAQTAINENNMDFISLSRPLIREPDLPQKWESGKSDTATCISCNKCFMPGLSKGGIYCVPQKAEDKKK